MDPNANLLEQLRIAKRIQQRSDAGNHSIPIEMAERFAELVQALDEWIRGGGFLPRVWNPKEMK